MENEDITRNNNKCHKKIQLFISGIGDGKTREVDIRIETPIFIIENMRKISYEEVQAQVHTIIIQPFFFDLIDRSGYKLKSLQLLGKESKTHIREYGNIQFFVKITPNVEYKYPESINTYDMKLKYIDSDHRTMVKFGRFSLLINKTTKDDYTSSQVVDQIKALVESDTFHEYLRMKGVNGLKEANRLVELSLSTNSLLIKFI